MLTITDKIKTYLTSGMELQMWGEYARNGFPEPKKPKRGEPEEEEEERGPTDTLTKVLATDERRKKYERDHRHKQIIVVSSRVHPGESNASFIFKGVLDGLTEQSDDAKFLRHNFIFKLVPMLNPDGVQHGHYRTSLMGVDLNRRWKEPSPLLHPTIFATKTLLKVSK